MTGIPTPAISPSSIPNFSDFTAPPVSMLFDHYGHHHAKKMTLTRIMDGSISINKSGHFYHPLDNRGSFYVTADHVDDKGDGDRKCHYHRRYYRIGEKVENEDDSIVSSDEDEDEDENDEKSKIIYDNKGRLIRKRAHLINRSAELRSPTSMCYFARVIPHGDNYIRSRLSGMDIIGADTWYFDDTWNNYGRIPELDGLTVGDAFKAINYNLDSINLAIKAAQLSHAYHRGLNNQWRSEEARDGMKRGSYPKSMAVSDNDSDNDSDVCSVCDDVE